MYSSSQLIKVVPFHTMPGAEDYDTFATGRNLTIPVEYDKSVYVAYGIYVLLIFILGLVQNSFTLYVFIKDRRLHKFHNYFIVGLAVSDVGMCLCGHWMIMVSSFTQSWQFKRAGCVYYGFATTMFGITQISLLAAIAFDRFVIIVKPRGFAFSKKKAVAAVFLCYIIGGLWALFPAVGWSSYQLEGIRVRCAINWRSQTVEDMSFTMSALILAWMVPLFVIVYSYAGIFHRLQAEQKTRFRTSLKQRSSRLKRDRKLAITVLLMIGAFLISWTPYSIVTLIVAFGKPEYVPTVVTIFPALIAKTSIIWNPIIYVARHSLFRKALFERVPCLRELFRQRKTKETAATFDTSRVSSIRDSSMGSNKMNITENALHDATCNETCV